MLILRVDRTSDISGGFVPSVFHYRIAGKISFDSCACIFIASRVKTEETDD